MASCAKYTEGLIRLCEKLAKHTMSADSFNRDERRTIINFALLLSFDPKAKTIIQDILPMLKHIQNMLQSHDNQIKESTVVFIHNVYSFGTMINKNQSIITIEMIIIYMSNSVLHKCYCYFIILFQNAVDQSKNLRLAADCIWAIKMYARARSKTTSGEKAHEIAAHHEQDLAAQCIQRFYRRYRYVSSRFLCYVKAFFDFLLHCIQYEDPLH